MIFAEEIKKLYVGKYLTLYRFEWVWNRNNEGDFKTVCWRTSNIVGEYRFSDSDDDGARYNLKWYKLHLDTMKMESFKFQITDVFIEVFDEYPHTERLAMSLHTFPENHGIFYSQLYTNLTISDV